MGGLQFQAHSHARVCAAKCSVSLRRPLQKGAGSAAFEVSTVSFTPVTAVTELQIRIGETVNVNEARRASTKVHLEPGDAKQQWKGEAAARFDIVQG